MKKIRKKRCKQYFFVGVLLLSLSANVVKGANGENIIASYGKIIQQQVIGNLIGVCLNVFVTPVLTEYTKYWFKRPNIIIRSSKYAKIWGKSEKLNQEMIFSDEVKLQLHDFSAITKKINEKSKNNSMVKYRNLLLHGPPGTGKTMFAEKLARRLHDEHGMEWIMVTGSGFFQEGAYIKAVNDIFIKEIKRNKKKGTIIIIDEADSLFSARKNLHPDSMAYRVINQILSFLGERTNDRMVIMTSNHLVFDSAMERRIDDAIKVPLPGNKERIETLRLYKNCFSLRSLTDEKIEKIAANTEGFSQSDLSGIVDKLKMKSDIDGDTNIEKNADIIVKEYHEKKQLFSQK